MSLIDEIEFYLQKKFIHQPFTLNLWNDYFSLLFGGIWVNRKTVLINCPFCRKEFSLDRNTVDEIETLTVDSSEENVCKLCFSNSGESILNCCQNDMLCKVCIIKLNKCNVKNLVELNHGVSVPVELYLRAERLVGEFGHNIIINAQDYERWYVKKRKKKLKFFHYMVNKKEESKLKKFTRNHEFVPVDESMPVMIP